MKKIKNRFGTYLDILPEGSGNLLDIDCDKGGFTSNYVLFKKASSVIGVDIGEDRIC